MGHIEVDSRRAVLDLAHAVMGAISRQIKVLPTAVIAAAMRPSITHEDLVARADAIVEAARAGGANLGVQSGREAFELGIEPLELRGVIVSEGGRLRVRDRNVLRYYARSIEHALASPSGRTH